MRWRLCICLALVGLAACGGDGGGADAVPRGMAGTAAPGGGPPAVPGLRPGVIELRRWRNPRQRVVIDKSGVALGPVGEPLARTLFITPERLRDLHFFLRTYAAFRTRTAEGELVFGGRGRFRAGPVERRMILEWTRLAAAEAMGGRSGAAYGLVLAWHRGQGTGSCDDLAVYLTGEVRAGSCSWQEEMTGRLRPELLARIYARFDRLKPLQAGGAGAAGAEQEQSRLIFAGRGKEEATPEEVASLRALAPALHRELAARRPSPPPPPSPQPVPPEETGRDRTKPRLPPEPPAPEPPPGPSLLLPPEMPGDLPLPEAKLPPYIPPPPIQKEKPASEPASSSEVQNQ